MQRSRSAAVNAWRALAETDLRMARLAMADAPPMYRQVCFHVHQVERTAEIRRRLRKAVTAWFGATSPALVPFGITPRVNLGGRKRRVAKIAAGKAAFVQA